ncbi:ABC-2 type transport system permease protein [Amphibacillus marinus]|uniref:ABC-2 type transport system permease protein n=1 Tax=Amphibacillus marinus TaxID=872970 RepID=A0A1H8K3R9_9BACI|nr:ABC transporter permease [Amphibacillus marinus]SEN87465.1 ABC-2 type transport system permease protein [Amphibacillus marinus]
MLTVFNLQWLRLIREPVLVFTFFGLTIGFVFFLAGSQGSSTITIQTFSDTLSEQEVAVWLERLNESDTYTFNYNEREEVENELRMSQISFALNLEADNYSFLVGQDSHFIAAANQHIMQTFQSYLRINEVNAQLTDETVSIEHYVQSDVKTLSTNVSEHDEMGLHVVAGMTLYFVIYTILFNLSNIVLEKKTGTWDRLIISPLKKTQIYIGQLAHHFMLGMLQIIISFVLFHFMLGYNFGTQLLTIVAVVMAYVFSIVALGMLVMGLVRSSQQLQAAIPIVATAMAMLGGAFWPLEIVTNNILLFLARLVPIRYGLEALIRTIVYNDSLLDVIQPVSILLLMGVIFMGLGINLMEKIK